VYYKHRYYYDKNKHHRLIHDSKNRPFDELCIERRPSPCSKHFKQLRNVREAIAASIQYQFSTFAVSKNVSSLKCDSTCKKRILELWSTNFDPEFLRKRIFAEQALTKLIILSLTFLVHQHFQVGTKTYLLWNQLRTNRVLTSKDTKTNILTTSSPFIYLYNLPFTWPNVTNEISLQ